MRGVLWSWPVAILVGGAAGITTQLVSVQGSGGVGLGPPVLLALYWAWYLAKRNRRPIGGRSDLSALAVFSSAAFLLGAVAYGFSEALLGLLMSAPFATMIGGVFTSIILWLSGSPWKKAKG